jgi:hypothetical protein
LALAQVAEAKKEDVIKMIRRFTTSRSAVLIISYETFRIYQKHFQKGAQVRAAGLRRGNRCSTRWA